MHRTALLLPLLLAACNAGPEVSATNASAEEVAAKVDAATAGKALVSPGRWETNVSVTDIAIPGMAPGMAEQMKQGHGGMARAVVTCLSEAEASTPKESFFGGEATRNCRYDKFTMDDGAIDAVFQCDQQGVQQTMTMKGQYTPDTYDLTMTSVGKPSAPGAAASPMAAMSMTMKVAGKRTGACTGDESNAPANPG